jgi:hypothetical protein
MPILSLGWHTFPMPSKVREIAEITNTYGISRYLELYHEKGLFPTPNRVGKSCIYTEF